MSDKTWGELIPVDKKLREFSFHSNQGMDGHTEQVRVTLIRGFELFNTRKVIWKIKDLDSTKDEMVNKLLENIKESIILLNKRKIQDAMIDTDWEVIVNKIEEYKKN